MQLGDFRRFGGERKKGYLSSEQRPREHPRSKDIFTRLDNGRERMI